ncbi:MAG: LLM class F420-dependent oxidoreductase [Gammaproteobacteria bacterium]|nr:LLM class F420-dependent oxidoreductase [Gammaproteobacteria bacterium]
MDFGVLMFPTDQAIQPIELAKAVEDRGFESLWFPEHSHIPVSRETPWGGFKGMPPLPEEYKRTHDQFVALAACAAVTTKLMLGTGITLVAQRDPLWTAKEVASLDMISGGRFLFGIGYGWNREEMRNHKLAFKDRRAVLRENILLMKELWTKDEAGFEGTHVKVEKSWAWPKPVTKPHPPIILGGAAGPKTYPDLIEFCDGWMPIGGLHDVEGGLKGMREAFRSAGRDLSTLDLGVFFPMGFDATQVPALADLGVKRVVLPLPPKPAAEVLPILDGYAKLIG